MKLHHPQTFIKKAYSNKLLWVIILFSIVVSTVPLFFYVLNGLDVMKLEQDVGRGNLLPSHRPAQPAGHDQDTGASARTFSILPPHPKPCPHAPSWSKDTHVYTSASTIPLFPSCLEMALMRKTALSLFKSNILTVIIQSMLKMK